MMVHFYTTIEYEKEISECEAAAVLDYAIAHNINMQTSVELLESAGVISLSDAKEIGCYTRVRKVED